MGKLESSKIDLNHSTLIVNNSNTDTQVDMFSSFSQSEPAQNDNPEVHEEHKVDVGTFQPKKDKQAKKELSKNQRKKINQKKNKKITEIKSAFDGDFSLEKATQIASEWMTIADEDDSQTISFEEFKDFV